MSLNQQAPYPVIEALVGPAQLASNTVTLHDHQLVGERLSCGMRVELKDPSGALYAGVVDKRIGRTWAVFLVCPVIAADLVSIGSGSEAVLELSEGERRGLLPGRWVVLIGDDKGRYGAPDDHQEWQVTAIEGTQVRLARR